MQIRGYKPLLSVYWGNTPGGDSILEMVAEKGSFELFQEIISQGVNLDPRDPVCYKALLRAASSGQTEVVSYFLQHCLDVNGTYRT
jgi:ankyrin repeat protein